MPNLVMAQDTANSFRGFMCCEDFFAFLKRAIFVNFLDCIYGSPCRSWLFVCFGILNIPSPVILIVLGVSRKEGL